MPYNNVSIPDELFEVNARSVNLGTLSRDLPDNTQMDDRELLSHSDPELIAALEFFLAERGWRQAELSRRTGINASTISDWLNGRYEPGGEALRLLCEAFGVSRSEFWSQGEHLIEERRRKPGREEARRRLRKVEATMRRELLPELRRVLEEMGRSSGKSKSGDVGLDLTPPSRRETS